MEKDIYFLVYVKKEKEEDNLLELLKEEEFDCMAGSWGCPWYFIDIEYKTYKPGRPGVCYGKVIGEHAITFNEFKTIYDIYKKYDDLDVLEMRRRK